LINSADSDDRERLCCTNLNDETTFRYIFHQPKDPNREIHLAVMVFDVPAKKKGKVSDVG